MVAPNEMRRTYTKTKLGDIHVQEMANTTIGVVGNDGQSNIDVAGHDGFLTTVRYSEGQMATIVLITNENSAKLIEVGDSLDNPEQDILFRGFLQTLLTATE